MAIPFPPALFPIAVSFWIENVSRSGGPSITGNEMIVSANSGRWRATATFNVHRETKILQWRGFLAGIDGRAGAFEIGPFDRYRGLDATGQRTSGVISAGIACEYFLDGTGFGQTQQAYATLAANAALGATAISVTAAAAWMAPRPGQYFGIGTRLYMVTRLYRAADTGPWTVEFRPRLRAAATTGAVVITDRPVCEMRLMNDDSGALELAFGQSGQATLDMVEAF